MPEFSIILPVRNGGDYVKDCIRSILAQTHRDFELVILDNNSSDGSLQWFQSLQDPRIKIHVSETSLSIEDNWARVLKVPKHHFMTLIGHDDLLHENYLETMKALINKYPDASLYQAHFIYIDAKGQLLRKCKTMAEKESTEAFLKEFLRDEIDVMGTGFMMRSSDYDAMGGIPNYPNLLFADFELWLKLTALKYKATSPVECFSFRIHSSTTAISPDIKFQKAFGQFINFLKNAAGQNESMRTVIREHAGGFLMKYCRGLAHRLLRTQKENRGNLTVAGFVTECRKFAFSLGIENFKPERIPSIRIAILLDKYGWSRNLFLFFKKIHPNPWLK